MTSSLAAALSCCSLVAVMMLWTSVTPEPAARGSQDMSFHYRVAEETSPGSVVADLQADFTRLYQQRDRGG